MQQFRNRCLSLGALPTTPSLSLLGLEPSSHCSSTCTVNCSLVRLLWVGSGGREEHQAEMARATDHWCISPPSFRTVLSPCCFCISFQASWRIQSSWWPWQVTCGTGTSLAFESWACPPYPFRWLQGTKKGEDWVLALGKPARLRVVLSSGPQPCMTSGP